MPGRRQFLKTLIAGAIGAAVAPALAKHEQLLWTQPVSVTGHDAKIALIKKLIEDAINAHDQALEEAIFGTTTCRDLGGETYVGPVAPYRELGVSITWSTPE